MKLAKPDVGIAILIFALAMQQGLAYGIPRAIAVGGALGLYYIVARLLVWFVITAVKRFRRTSQ